MYKKLLSRNLLCTGCGACVNACLQNAINYIYDYEKDGSMVAEIERGKCISCHLCEEVCPVLSPKENSNDKVNECYAVWAKDSIRMQSSSGGAFTVFAENILHRGGYVCAVAYGNEFKAEHIIISDAKDLSELRRSKYVQSDVGYIYRQIKELLVQNKEVLFVGTPCQVAGVKAFLGKPYENLILVDIFCNYTPSYPLFRKYLCENYDVKQVDKIDFRVKKYGWRCDIHTITESNGEVLERRPYNDAFQRGYHPRLFMRETCEKCRFSANPRQGDLSIADFWHIGEFYPELDDTKGTSCVVVNNEKGACFFEKIKPVLAMCEKVPLDCMKYNRGECVSPHPARNRFYELIKTRSFNQSVEFALNGKYDAVIWGNWSEKNYGSELTYYALYETLVDLGLDPLMVERPKNAIWGPNETPVLFKEFPYKDGALHELFPDKAAMYELNEKSEIFIVGSDQLWHRNLYHDFGQVAFFDYIYNDKKKIAYAASFGREYWSGDSYETQEAAVFLKDFDYVSVREQSGVDVCKKYFDVDALCVLDPVFLCQKQKYKVLAAKSTIAIRRSYIGGYILDITPLKLQILQSAQQSKSMPCEIMTDAFRETLQDVGDITVHKNVFCEDWLSNIIHSDFVITDSFHGMCFAIIFNKPFIAICNQERGSVRFTDLLEQLGLSERLISEKTQINEVKRLMETPIDYATVEARINREKIRSLHWLEHALKAPKDYTLREYDILLRKIQSAESQFDSVQRKIPYIEHELGNRKWDISVHRKELNDRLWDIQVHRKELNELFQDIRIHRSEIAEIRQKQSELEEKVDRINNYLIIRIWKKLSKFLHVQK